MAVDRSPALKFFGFSYRSREQEYSCSLVLVVCMYSVMPDSLKPHELYPPGSPVHEIFSRQEYWSELPFPSPGDLPNPGTKPPFLASAAWQVDSLPLRHPHLNDLHACLPLV